MQDKKHISPVLAKQIEEFANLGERLAAVADSSFHITLTDFRAKLLPLLAKAGDGFDIDAWERVVENAYRDVVVVSDTGDSVVYHIPGIIRQLETSANLGERLNDHQKEMQQVAVDQPIQHSEIVYASMCATRGDDEPDAVSAKHMADVLIKILTDHNLKLPEHVVAGTADGAAVAQDAQMPVDDDYEKEYELP